MSKNLRIVLKGFELGLIIEIGVSRRDRSFIEVSGGSKA